MQPTLGEGDGFVAIPSAVAGEIDEGDVVTFRAKEIEGGTLTTHRVVGVTDRGYLTKGDNNPFTDQDDGEPPVKRAQIVAVAWQPAGTVLAIPGVGMLVTGTQDIFGAIQGWLTDLLGTGAFFGTQGLAYLLLGFSLLAYVADVLLHRDEKQRHRERSRETGTNARLAMAMIAGAVVLAATVTMVAPSGPQEFGVVSAETDSPGIDVIEAGTNESTTYVLGNGGAVPMVTHFEPATDGVSVEPREAVIPARSTTNATLTLSAPPETGYYRQYLVEHRYLLVMPQPVIRALHGVHPWLPIVVIDAVLGVPFYLVGVSLMGTGRLRSRSRETPSRLQWIRSRLTYRRQR